MCGGAPQHRTAPLLLPLTAAPRSPCRWSTSRAVCASGWLWRTAARCPTRSWGWWWWLTLCRRPPSTRSASTVRCLWPESTWTWRLSTVKTGGWMTQIQAFRSDRLCTPHRSFNQSLILSWKNKRWNVVWWEKEEKFAFSADSLHTGGRKNQTNESSMNPVNADSCGHWTRSRRILIKLREFRTSAKH